MKLFFSHRSVISGVLVLPVIFSAALITAAELLSPEVSQPTEFEVKAAFLFKFAKFIEWPSTAFESDESELIVGVLGPDDLVATVVAVIGQKTVKNRRIVVKQFKWFSDIDHCHILFIDKHKEDRLPRIFKHIKSKPVLTVGNSIDGFAEDGGIINLIVDNNLVSFEINPQVASQLDLEISSKLLRLAKIVGGSRGRSQ